MESFSSGMNFLKRRFSSQDMADEDRLATQNNATTVQQQSPVQQQQKQQQQQPTTSPPPPPTSFSLAGLANKVSSTISAPASPAKSQQSMYSQVQGITRNLMNAASSGLSSQPQGPHKCILVIDDQQIDWSKYFRSNRTGWQLCIEQASYADIHVCSHSDKECSVELTVQSSRERRTFQPDFVLFRQAAKSEKGDFTALTTALLKGGVHTLNSVDNVITFLNKNWMYHHLQRIATAASANVFPLLDQTYYPAFDHFNVCARYPVVVRVGHGIHGVGKVKVDDEQRLLELEGAIRAMGGGEVLVEPFLDVKYDVHLQKIGSETKAFVRKAISNGWRSNVGSAMLEQIAVTNRHRQWLHLVSEAFGGMDMLGMDVLVTKDGREVIHDVNDVLTFLGDSQEEDRRAIADLIQTHLVRNTQSTEQHKASLTKAAEPPQPSSGPPAAAPPPPPRPNPSVVSRSKTADQNISNISPMNGHTNTTATRSVSRDPSQSGVVPSRPVRQGTVGDGTECRAVPSSTHQDDTMGQLKRTFAGIFGDA